MKTVASAFRSRCPCVSVSISPLDDRSERDEWLAQSERRLRELWDNKADDVYNELLAP